MTSGGDVGRLRLLASALAGRVVEVTTAPPTSLTWTDGATVYLSADCPPQDQLRAIAVQAALIGAGSLDTDTMAALRRRPVLAERYLAVEAHRALASHGTLVPPAARSLIDERLARRAGSPTQSLDIARSRAPLAVLDPIFGALRPRDTIDVARGEGADGGAGHRPRAQQSRPLVDLADDDPGAADGAVDMSSPVGGGGAIGRLLRLLLRSGRSRLSGPPSADAPTHRLRTATGGRGARVASMGRPVLVDDGNPLSRPSAFTYPEWDVHRHRYRPDWCTVKEVVPAGAPRTSGRAPNTHSLRLPLSKVVLDLDRRRRQLQGDDIDLDACIAAHVELASGGAPDESVYVDVVRRRRDLAVLVLLDVSGSAREPGTAGASVHDSQRATAAELTFAFHDLGDRTALYGFRSIGRSEVQLIPVKRFEDRLGAAVLGRLDELDPGAYTRLGAAIRHGARQLEEHGGTRRRLLVVISDGFAYDHGYEGAYGEADARRALSEARRRGIGCLCLSVGAKTDVAALSRVFGTAAHAVVPRPEELAPIARRLFHTALKSAEEQRRSA